MKMWKESILIKLQTASKLTQEDFFMKKFQKTFAVAYDSETAQKMKFSIKDFFSKYDQISSFLLKKSLMENFIFEQSEAYAGLPETSKIESILQQ